MLRNAGVPGESRDPLVVVGTPWPTPLETEAEGFWLLEAAAAAAACRLAMLLCRNNGTPEKALRFEASLSAASWRFHLFLLF